MKTEEPHDPFGHVILGRQAGLFCSLCGKPVVVTGATETGRWIWTHDE